MISSGPVYRVKKSAFSCCLLHPCATFLHWDTASRNSPVLFRTQCLCCWKYIRSGVFPVDCNTLGTCGCPPRYDPRSNNQTSAYAWRHTEIVYCGTNCPITEQIVQLRNKLLPRNPVGSSLTPTCTDRCFVFQVSNKILRNKLLIMPQSYWRWRWLPVGFPGIMELDIVIIYKIFCCMYSNLLHVQVSYCKYPIASIKPPSTLYFPK